jgi:tetratricopeptide (TPR) repeat protein
MTRWSAITRTPPPLLRARLRLALHSRGGNNLNPVVHHERGRYSLEHAQRAGDHHRARHCLSGICTSLLFGPAPANEVLERLSRLSEGLPSLLTTRDVTRVIGSVIASYFGHFAEAREGLRAAMLRAAELGDPVTEAHLPQLLGMVELLAGNTAEAECVLRAGFDRLGELGEAGWRASIATQLADALARQGREDEALEVLGIANELALPDDFDVQVRARFVRAQILTRRGNVAIAEPLAREAVEIAASTDALVLHGDALLALAEVQRASGAAEPSKEALRQALELFERKENIVQAEQTRARIAEVETLLPSASSNDA